MRLFFCFFCAVAPVLGAHGMEISHLRTALSVAVEAHPALLAKKLETRAAEAEVKAARWQYWPTPVISWSLPNKSLIDGADKSVYSVGIKQPLWTGGRLEASVRYAQARNQTAHASFEESRRDIAIELIRTWGEASSAKSRQKVYRESVLIHQKLLQQVLRRTQAGLSVQSDVALASVRLDTVMADLVAADAAFQAASERLRTLTADHVIAGVEIPETLITSLLADEDVTAVVKIDPTLNRLHSELSELQAQVDNGKSAFWPELSATLTQRHGDVTGRINQLSVGFESKWGAGLSGVAAVQASMQRVLAKQQEIESRTRQLIEQIRSDQQQLHASRARLKAFGQALIFANDVADSWGRQFAAGKKTWQEVMNAARESTQTELQLVEAQVNSSVIDWRLAVMTRGVDWVLMSTKEKP